jgi:hypothetical protein
MKHGLLNIKIRQVFCLYLFLFIIITATAQDHELKKSFEVYGYIKTDIGYNFEQIDPIRCRAHVWFRNVCRNGDKPMVHLHSIFLIRTFFFMVQSIGLLTEAYLN